MKVADLSTGSSKLREALDSLHVHWEYTKTHWHDQVGQSFEEEFLQLLDQRVRSSLERMNHLAQVLVAAHHECSE